MRIGPAARDRSLRAPRRAKWRRRAPSVRDRRGGRRFRHRLRRRLPRRGRLSAAPAAARLDVGERALALAVGRPGEAAGGLPAPPRRTRVLAERIRRRDRSSEAPHSLLADVVVAGIDCCGHVNASLHITSLVWPSMFLSLAPSACRAHGDHSPLRVGAIVHIRSTRLPRLITSRLLLGARCVGASPRSWLCPRADGIFQSFARERPTPSGHLGGRRRRRPSCRGQEQANDQQVEAKPTEHPSRRRLARVGGLFAGRRRVGSPRTYARCPIGA
jgi:hypothetical protein